MLSSRWMNGAAALAVLAVMAPQAFAQSTGTQEVEKVVVTGTRAGVGGVIVKEKATKTRSTITDKYIGAQSAGQTVAQNLNILPGVNFTNSDAYGSSGGNVRIRGFDGARVSFQQDGIPLNDTGNYAIFTNQAIDGEYLSRATVNTGTTDVDSPTASATGGTINTVTRKPYETLTLSLGAAAGSDNYQRFIGVVDIGKYAGTSAFAGVSFQEYDKFKGPGQLQKTQGNGRIFKEIGENSFVSVIGHYNENRNNFYRNLTKAQIAFYGQDYDNLATCTRLAGGAGAQNEGSTSVVDPAFLSTSDNPANAGSCSNFFGVRVNPSNTGNVRAQGSFQLTDDLKLTIDPSWQYVKANGGGSTVVSETDGRLKGLPAGAGIDLNGDGDQLDSIRLYSPSNTNTNRYTVTTSLIWSFDTGQSLRAAYTGEVGRHRQTGAFGRLDPSGNPVEVFGGLDVPSARVATVDGSFLRSRDRLSMAILNQFSLSYKGAFFDEKLNIDVGLRAPFFTRDLDQRCYTPTTASSTGFITPHCTTEAFVDPDADGIGTFASLGAAVYARPYKATFEYDAVLPNLGVSYEFLENTTVYASYAEGLSAPRTDSLYAAKSDEAGALPGITTYPGVDPEKSKAFDLGLRYQGAMVTASMAFWKNMYQNRYVSAFDPDLGFVVDRNIGNVELQGFDVELGVRPIDNLTVYGSASYLETEMEANISRGSVATNVFPTSGKSLVESPDWTYAGRVEYVIENVTLGLQGKYVGDRFATDVNDEIAPSYTVFDANAVVDLSVWGLADTIIQLNGTNIFDEKYLGSISSTTNAVTITDTDPGTVGNQTANGSAPTYSIGAPQTIQLQVRTKF